MQSKIFTEEEDRWLMDHKAYKPASQVVPMFMQIFPGHYKTDVHKHRYAIDAYVQKKTKRSFFEIRNTENGYLAEKWLRQTLYIQSGKVKVKWIPKGKFYYLKYHPDFIPVKNDAYVFLDGDTDNISEDNIARLTASEMQQFNRLGGVVKGSAELTKLRIQQASLKVAIIRYQIKNGLRRVYERGSVDPEAVKEWTQEDRKKNPGKYSDRMKRYVENLKQNHPEKYVALQAKRKEYQKRYRERQKLKEAEK